MERKNKLGHLLSDENKTAAQYVEERQAILPPIRKYPMPPASYTAKSKLPSLRVQQVTYTDVKRMPIDVVADLWGVRFGTDWAAHDDVQKEELAAALAQRLINENLLEQVVMTNPMRTMYRLGTTGWRE